MVQFLIESCFFKNRYIYLYIYLLGIRAKKILLGGLAGMFMEIGDRQFFESNLNSLYRQLYAIQELLKKLLIIISQSEETDIKEDK